MKKLNLKKKKGFTLIELIIVVAILGILSSIAIPKFGSAQKDAKITADIANARIIANAVTMAITKGQIILTTGTQYKSASESTISAELQSVPVPKAITGVFSVSIDSNGTVLVYAAGTTVSDTATAIVAKQVYPDPGIANTWYVH